MNHFQSYQSARADYDAALALGDAGLIAETLSLMTAAHRTMIIDERKQERFYTGKLGYSSRSTRHGSCGGMHINGSASAPCPRPW